MSRQRAVRCSAMATPRRLAPEDVEALVLARLCVADGRVEQARSAAHMTQAEFGAFCQVTESAVCHWEAGRRVPRSEEAIRLGRLLRQLGVKSRRPPKEAVS